MASYYGGGYNNSSQHYHNPSAPPLPDSQPAGSAHPYYAPSLPHPPPSNYYNGQPDYGSGSAYGYPSFPPGTNPEVIRSFQMADRDRSGFIDDMELQQALSSSGFQRFSLRTIRLLMFLFKNPNDSLRIGPKEFAALWSSLSQWQSIFQRFDRDRSGKIDSSELRDALYSLGYAIPPSILQVLISRYDDGSGRRVELNFDSFVECGMVVKGLTEKFKEKDPSYSGSATLTYDTFMCMILPFIVSYS